VTSPARLKSERGRAPMRLYHSSVVNVLRPPASTAAGVLDRRTDGHQRRICPSPGAERSLHRVSARPRRKTLTAPYLTIAYARGHVKRSEPKTLNLVRAGPPHGPAGKRAAGRCRACRPSMPGGLTRLTYAAESWNTLCGGTVEPACGSLQPVDARCVQQLTPLATSPLILLLVCEGRVRPWPWSGRNAS
jgi:hypothetical protein